MWRIGRVLTVLAVAGSLGCVSTARFDDAHRKRVAAIDARYAAERAQPAAPAQLDAERQAAITASLAQRDREVAADRAAHRARVQANAFAAADPGPVAAALCLDAAADPPLLRTAGCRPAPRTHDAAPVQVSQPGPAPARE